MKTKGLEAMSWTDERVETLKTLWADGLSASTIAAQLGEVTRNAVIGKVHRLGLSGRAKATAQPVQRVAKVTRAPSHPMRPAVLVRGNTALAVDVVAYAEPAPVQQHRPVENVVVPMSERVTIMELREQMCRWPLGDPGREDFRFCGCRIMPGSGPYCSQHATLAYQPTIERRRDRDRRMMRA